MRIAEIIDGVVKNVIEVDPETRPAFFDGWPEAGAAGPGWLFADGVFSPPQTDPVEELAAAREAASLPKAEFCLGLVQLGILMADDAVSAARGNWPEAMAGFLDYLTPEQAAQVQIEWATRVTIWRMNTFVLVLASWAGLPDATVDTLFGIAV